MGRVNLALWYRNVLDGHGGPPCLCRVPWSHPPVPRYVWSLIQAHDSYLVDSMLRSAVVGGLVSCSDEDVPP